MSVNIKNKELFLSLKQKHLSEKGTHPDAYATTELIKKSIEDRSYSIYRSNGRDIDGNSVREFDVIVTFSLANDPEFCLCIDSSEGDQCDVLTLGDKGELYKSVI